MFLEQISWKQAEDYFKKRDLAVIPVGSTENHGSQLALGTDFLIPRNLCERMDSRLNCLIAPTIPYGVADQHTHFPGTITIGYDGLYDLVTRIADQLYGHGIRHFVFLNGHGGNTPVLQRVCMELDDKHAVGCVLDWWSLAGELNPPGKADTAAAKRRRPCWPSIPNTSIWTASSHSSRKNLTDALTYGGAANVSFRGITIPVPVM